MELKRIIGIEMIATSRQASSNGRAISRMISIWMISAASVTAPAKAALLLARFMYW